MNQKGFAPIILILGILVVAVAGGAYYYGKSQGFKLESRNQIVSQIPQQTITPVPSATDKLFVVNSNQGPNQYFTFQIQFPSNYVATSDDMLTDFKSQGGMAPPRLILTKATQPLSPDKNGYLDYTYLLKNNTDCIMIWTTMGYSGFDSWEDSVYPFLSGNVATKNQIEVLSSSQIKIGKYEGLIREVKDAIYPQRIEAFVKMPDNDTTYFFHTCNINTKQDLNTILQNFRVREQL